MKNTQRINKTEIVFARVTPIIAQQFSEMAAANGRRPSEELRAIIVEHLDKYAQRQAQQERASA